MPYYPEEYPGIPIATGITAVSSSYAYGLYNKFVRGLDGHLFTVWKRSSDNKIYIGESVTNGDTWNHTEVTLISASNSGRPALTVKSDGTLVLCICSIETGDASYRPYVMEKPVGGAWQNRVKLSATINGNSSHMAICTDKNDHIHIVVTSYASDTIYYFTDESGSWSAEEDFNLANTSSTTGYLSIQADSNDNIFFAYNWYVAAQNHTYVAVRSAGVWGAFLDLAAIVYAAYGYADERTYGAHVFSADDDTIYVSFSSVGDIDRSFIVWSDDLFVTTSYCRVGTTNSTGTPQTIVTPTGQFIVLTMLSVPLTQYWTYEFVSNDQGATWTNRVVLPAYKYPGTSTRTRQRCHIGTQRYPSFARLANSWQGISSYTTSYDTTTETLSYFIRHNFLPSVSQFVIEVDLVPQGGSSVTQFVLEVEEGTDYSTPCDITQFIIEVEENEDTSSTVDDDFTADATIVSPTTQQWTFSADARIRMVHTQGRVFTADAVLYKAGPPQFTASAKIRKPVPTLTWFYPDFRGPYEVRLLDHDGTLIETLTQFTHLEFTRTVNGQFHHGYGAFSLVGASAVLPTDEFLLDRILQVRRVPLHQTPVVVYEGLCRFFSPYHDDQGREMFALAGHDLKQLMKRRIVLPPAGNAFLDINAPMTDVMRLLTINNATHLAAAARQMPRLRVLPLTGDGVPLNLHYRHTILSDELDALADAEEGADWSIDQNGSYLDFNIFYPLKGKDRRRGSSQGWDEMVWSLDRANIVSPKFTEDRVEEVTVTYVGGDGIGEDRTIVERANIADRQFDSPWNRVEHFIDSASETSLAVLYAQGDANNVERGLKRLFSVEAAPKEVLTYGQRWNLGDLCTGEYTLGGTFDMRIVEVREILDPEGGHITVEPTFYVYPRLQDY